MAAPPLAAAERFFILAATTSTDDSGLLDHLIPTFTAETGIAVRTLVRGTGQAVRVAKAGDADVLMVHHRASEEAFVNEGYGVRRFDVMYNDFILVGPQDDPAGLSGEDDIAAALLKIAAAAAPFASRGDRSGTHEKEQALWAAAGLDPARVSGQWYRETGAGMGATLNTAAALGAYSLADRGSWASFRNKRDLKILLAGDPRLHNPYSIILVNPARHPHVKAAEGEAFIDWILSPAGQAAIAAFRINGEQLFFPYYERGKDSS
jgi:tungstate transport system substrate-binding protein